jgi:hypothetical protein
LFACKKAEVILGALRLDVMQRITVILSYWICEHRIGNVIKEMSWLPQMTWTSTRAHSAALHALFLVDIM